MMLPAMKPQQWTLWSGRALLLDPQCLFSLLLAYCHPLGIMRCGCVSV